MKHSVDLNEGPDAFARFREAVKSVLKVRKSELPPKPSRKRKTAKRRKP